MAMSSRKKIIRNRPQPKDKELKATSFSPLYKQIKKLLLQSLEGNEFKPGESIPSEQELAVRFEVSQGTVRKAIDELSAENVLIRRQGKGTFVATHHEPQVRYRFLRIASDDPSQALRTQTTFLSCETQVPTAEMRKLFELTANQHVICIARVMKFSGQPAIYEKIYLPEPIFQGLTLEVLNRHKMPLYGLFESYFGVQLLRCDEKIRAIASSDEIAEHLSVAAGTPLLSVERISYTYGEKPVEIRKGLYTTQDYYYRNSLK